MSASDERLVNAAVLGDRDAFEAFIMRNGPSILRYAQNMLSDDEVAATIVRDAFVTAWERLDSVGPGVSPRTWLYALTTYEITALQIGHGEVDVPTERPTGCERSHVSSALADLSQRQRTAWLLHEVEGLPLAEVGWILGCTCDTARAHLTRAKAALREGLSAGGTATVR